MYILTPYSKNFQPLAYWEGAFNDDELNWIQIKAREAREVAVVGGGGSHGVVSEEIRRSEVSWLIHSNETDWIFNRLAHVVSTLNSEFFFFDLTGFGEPFQLTNYHERYSGKYGWHVDFGSNTNSPSRKLSLVLQLSNPLDYEGGDLEVKPFSDHVIKIKKQRGLIVCFPSWTLHQVTPVTKGSRQSLVSWITGPSFK